MQRQNGTEGVALSGKQTSSGRTSGETIFGAEGAIRVTPSISQAKGQSMLITYFIYYVLFRISEVKSHRFGLKIFKKECFYEQNL